MLIDVYLSYLLVQNFEICVPYLSQLKGADAHVFPTLKRQE